MRLSSMWFEFCGVSAAVLELMFNFVVACLVVFAVVVAASFLAGCAHGDELIFSSSQPATCEAVSLFPCERPVVSLFSAPVYLFAPCATQAIEQKTEAKAEQAGAEEPREKIHVYSPDWCSICSRDKSAIGNGDKNLEVVWITGSEKNFPKFIRDFASEPGNVYPVQYWKSPRGKWALHCRSKSLDELHGLVKIEPGQTPSYQPIVKK